MARMPGAQWRPLGDDQTHQPLMSKHDGIVLHTMVGSLEGTEEYFRHGNGGGYVGTESHFGVGYDGTIYQWVDTARTADANLEGNSRLLSIETADSGTGFPKWDGSNVPPWTPAQKVAISRIIAWAAEEDDFPIVRMPDSKPSTRGVGDHRLGIDPYRVAGGEKWSDSYAKACPGDERIEDMDEVIEGARNVGGDPWPHIRDKSPAVAGMVEKLEAGGYFNGAHRDAPNYFGKWTKDAIRRLQGSFDDTKADPDGVIGPLTWAHIQAIETPPDEPPKRDPVKYPLVQRAQEQRATANTALVAEIASLSAAVKAHPGWTYGAGLLAATQVELTRGRIAHTALQEINHPKEK